MDSSLRRFAQREAAMADQWSETVFLPGAWRLADDVGAGESQSKHVYNDEGLHGIAKPAFMNDAPRAAHEKIASDLAHLAGVPVPPVLLWTDEAGTKFAVSLWAFAQPLTWGQASHLRAQLSFMKACYPTLAAGHVFHTWIGDTDHNGNEGNILIDAESTMEKPGLAFIDHAFSMSYAWGSAQPDLSDMGGYVPLCDLPQDDIANAVKMVQNVSAEAIERIVKRIPASFLAEDRASLIVDALRYRQERIKGFFGI